MRKIIFISVVFLFSISSFSLTAQEVKSKLVVEQEKPSIEIIVNGNRITVQNATVGQKLEIFSVVGLKVDEYILKTSPVELILNVPKGYYIFKIGETVRKVVIK